MSDTLKVCGKCKAAKMEEEFSFRNKSKGLRANTCKLCHSFYSKQWFHKNKKRHQESSAKSGKKWRLKKKMEAQVIVNTIKSGPCIDCKGQFKTWQMQFDHRVGTTKRFNVAHGVHWAYNRKFSIEVILEEIEKCDLVCANCHANRTYRRNHHEDFSQ